MQYNARQKLVRKRRVILGFLLNWSLKIKQFWTETRLSNG